MPHCNKLVNEVLILQNTLVVTMKNRGRSCKKGDMVSIMHNVSQRLPGPPSKMRTVSSISLGHLQVWTHLGSQPHVLGIHAGVRMSGSLNPESSRSKLYLVIVSALQSTHPEKKHLCIYYR